MRPLLAAIAVTVATCAAAGCGGEDDEPPPVGPSIRTDTGAGPAPGAPDDEEARIKVIAPASHLENAVDALAERAAFNADQCRGEGSGEAACLRERLETTGADIDREAGNVREALRGLPPSDCNASATTLAERGEAVSEQIDAELVGSARSADGYAQLIEEELGAELDAFEAALQEQIELCIGSP